MFLHVKVTFHFIFEREGVCLQALRMRENIHFGSLCWDDAVT